MADFFFLMRYAKYILLLFIPALCLNSCTVFKTTPPFLPFSFSPVQHEICFCEVPFTASVDIKSVAARPVHLDFDSLYLSMMDTTVKMYDLPGFNLMTANENLKDFLDEWLHTRYSRGGSSRRGTDCSGFVNSLYRDVYGIKLSRSSYTMINDVVKVPVSELKEGDLVFFKIRGGRISHVGFYLKDHYFVHAARRGGVIISSLDEPYYKRTFYAGGRVRS